MIQGNKPGKVDAILDQSIPSYNSTAPQNPRKTPSQTPKRQRTSMIWFYCKNLSDGSPVIDQDGDKAWRCVYCDKTYKHKSGTTKAADHLRKLHSIDTSKMNDSLQQREDKSSVLRKTNNLDAGVLEELYLRWTSKYSIPAEQVAWPEFRTFLEYVSPEANRLLPLVLEEGRFLPQG
jgi:hypothetical protein